MSVRINKGQSLATLSMTPLIDVVFLLLIFFLVATHFADEERQLDIRLPESTAAMPLVSEPGELFINVDERGQCFVGGHAIEHEALLGVLRQAAADNPGRESVVIRADRRCVWQHVVAVMDACNHANIDDYRVTAIEPNS